MRRAFFLLYPGFELIDFAGPFQVFHEAKKLGLGIEPSACSESSEALSEQGIRISSIAPLPAFGEDDWVMVPGHTLESTSVPGWMIAVLGEARRAGSRIISTCTGAFILGEAGLLDGRSCTTHWKRIGELERRFPGARVLSDRIFVEDGRVVTSGGATCGIDLALHLIEAERSPLFASRVARELIVYMRRDGLHAQTSVYLDYRNHNNPGVHAAQDWLIENPGERACIEDLARIAGMSPRNLDRCFREATGATPAEYRNLLRLERAMKMLNDPLMTVEAVAAECGFPDARSLRRQWKKRYGLTPRGREARAS
jgi:transcriptional regulator GlxA family with amidase domain